MFRALGLGANTLDLIRLELFKTTPPSLSCLTLSVSSPTSNRTGSSVFTLSSVMPHYIAAHQTE